MDKRVKRFLSLVMAVAMSLAMFLVPAQAYGTNMEGRYFLSTALNHNLALDVSDGVGENGTNIQIYESNWTEAQDFTVEHVTDEWYVIKHTASGKFLDVESQSSASGTNVLLWEYDINPERFYYSQLWRFIKKSGGYAIQNGLGTYLDVCYGEAANGTNVWAYEGNNGKGQIWKLTSVYTNEIRLSSYDVQILKGYSARITAYFHGGDLNDFVFKAMPAYESGKYMSASSENLNRRWPGYTVGSIDWVMSGDNSTWSAGRAVGKSSQHYARYYLGITDSKGAFNGCITYLNVTVL